MQSTGHTSTHALSFTLMHGSAMMYGIEASQFSVSPAACSGWLNPWICTRISAACQALGRCSEVREAGVERWAARDAVRPLRDARSEEHTSELQSPCNLVCRLLLEKKKKTKS